MAYVAFRRDLSPRSEIAAANKARKPTFLRRVLAAVIESRQRKADRELANYVARSGGKLTDEIEREMMQQLTRTDWRNIG